MAILYPPIIDTYMPAFILSQDICRVYFSLSQYNTPTDIKCVCVTVNNQYTSQSVLNTKSGFKFLPLFVDDTRDGDDRYYIELLASRDLEGGKWEADQSYKVQVRLSAVDMAEDPAIDTIIAHQHNFSEWSRVCLIQGIEQPTLILNSFTDAEEDVTFTSYDTVSGRVIFTDKEQLKSYQIRIFNENDLSTCVYDSGVVYTDQYATNEINHTIKYGFIEGDRYVMKFTYTTEKLYEETSEYKFLIVDFGGQPLKATITAIPLDEEGRIAVQLKSNEEGFVGNITIRRTSNESNFSIWEDVHTITLSTEMELNYTWYDNTAESGVWYKYCAQRRSAKGNRGLIILTETPVMITMQDMFLVRGDQQLKVKFNPQINSFKRTVSESLTQTLGSKYPFIKRNANVYYREFPISGLISHFCDEEHLFMPEEEMYKMQKSLYEKYNEKNWITEYNDFTLERAFREKVEKFLYENNVKLFKSPSEGNILVRLMNVSFTPEQTLGRMIYSFSATAYEIDEANIDTYSKYHIWDVGTFSDQIVNNYIAEGYYHGIVQDDAPLVNTTKSRATSFSGFHDFNAYVQDLATGRESSELEKEVQYLKNISLEIESPPYLINTSNFTISIVEEGDPTDEGTVLGHLILVNHNPTVIGPSGVYNISDAEITSLGFPTGVKTEIGLQYSYSVVEREKVTEVPQQIYYSSKVGQLWGHYEPMDDLYSFMKDKVDYTYNKGYQKLFGVEKITVEADPGTVMYIRDTSSETFKRFEIGNTGSLMVGEGASYGINGLYLLGVHLDLRKEYGRTVLRDNEYVQYLEDTYYNVNSIPNPQERTMYLVNSTSGLTYHPGTVNTSLSDYHAKMHKWLQYGAMADHKYQYTVIYYKGGWYPFIVETGDIIMPIPQILVDYSYEVEKGEFT